MDSVVRLNLQYLDNPSKAFNIVRQSKSSEGAAMVATYCQQHRDFQSAIEFMLVSSMYSHVVCGILKIILAKVTCSLLRLRSEHDKHSIISMT